ncbi:Phenylalanyl-tRNA synthetase, beta subunit, cytoplasmic [Kluyveromyces marxianus]|uniref:phenylalanine--tRNA ligase n=2 Tax=Kluyveromyces marxianus TaxID=4911 RepID=W0TD76_KLUMD|nr:phenylalanyl-tRNA synthetase alpha chain [Kluyveromyces marxianus DMKU3-1042]KAG0670535.1 Phenylalanyl-tRNA synthetase, beta subunit, cytoplasmic [Kluyveromyces marxianus]KAG0683633.1 Phenylalanyl-tRNA synthetase, beta subunit, cytoplasmic [Kluyveromyces marxianus]QGN17262.1 phenylalanyl-tRNA synthetase alpha chain [Kluyveromyces marxianus]BAO41592.1 phenylalanyl-tRNA synthetase alpha chain [Kluyveromyces marxianus DMKU3-1042]BAP73031.1 phenylalanyl-tRNA synthetase alpha chain [Kluyveromyce
MSDIQLEILQKVDKLGQIDSTSEVYPDIDSQTMASYLNSLKSHDKIDFSKQDTIFYTLTKEAEDIVANGSHEVKLLQLIDKFGQLKIKDVSTHMGADGKVGQARAFKNGWIVKTPENELKVSDKVSDVAQVKDQTKEQLEKIKKNDLAGISDKDINDLKKRKLITPRKETTFKVVKGKDFSTELAKLETDITSEMVATGSYKDLKFKEFNFNSQGIDPQSGALHPLNKVREEFRQIFFSMGFTEMPSNQYVETGFWNFDTLFVPQQHPARDLQDTFYLKDPIKSGMPDDREYINNIKAVHETGKFDSIGYRYNWKEEECQKLVLRTHTTAISAAMLHKLAKDPKPTRLFSIDRVFRNEAVDATHLAEFHQVEGVLADYNITLGDLIQFMEDFFAKMGVTGLRFKPTYNPYTEPSLEIYSWHEGLGKWVEIGNSGMFRPEMLESMGLPKDMRVLGWGLSLERPTMIKYKVQNIRELLGHKVSLDFIESNPAARLDEDLYE